MECLLREVVFHVLHSEGCTGVKVHTVHVRSRVKGGRLGV